jgi:hypothetical protein
MFLLTLSAIAAVLPVPREHVLTDTAIAAMLPVLSEHVLTDTVTYSCCVACALRAYCDVPWDSTTPSRRWAPVKTLEEKADPIALNTPEKRYELAAEDWQVCESYLLVCMCVCTRARM